MRACRVAVLLGCALLSACRGGGFGRRDVFTIGVPYQPGTTLDPHRDATLSSHIALLHNVYEPLVTMDQDLRVTPALATSWSNPDEHTWTFELRPARFHDGRVVSAKDVVYSLERARRPGHDAGYYLTDVDSITAPGPMSVALHTLRPSPLLLNRLSFVLIVPAGLDDADFASRGIGTGPYAISDWLPDRRLGLKRHDAWWGARLPIESALVRYGTGEDEAVAAILRGDLQMVQVDSTSGLQRMQASERLRVLGSEGFYVTYLAFKLTQPPFADPRLRRAVSLGVDRTALAARLAQPVEPAGQLVTRHVFGFDPGLEVAGPDLVHARRLLREAGLETGLDVTLSVRPRFAEAADVVSAQLRAEGLRVRSERLPDATFFARLAKHELAAWVDSWACTTGDASELFENAMHSPDGKRFGGFNDTGYSSAALDKVIEQSVLLDTGARREVLQKLMGHVVAEAVWIPLYADHETYGLDRRYAWRPRPDRSIRLSELALATPEATRAEVPAPRE